MDEEEAGVKHSDQNDEGDVEMANAGSTQGAGSGGGSGNEPEESQEVPEDAEGAEDEGEEVTSEMDKMKEGLHAWAFYLGLTINVAIGPLLEMSAYAFAAQSLLAPFGGLDTVWNALLAPFTLGETLTCRRILGIVIIMLGTIGSALFGNHDDKDYTPQDFKDLLVTVRTLVYIICFAIWFSIGSWLVSTNPKGSFIRGLMLGVMGGSLAGNMFFVKVVTSLISTMFSEGVAGILDDWLIYVSLVFAVIIAVTNVQFLTKGMLENEALFMVTCFEGSMIASSAGSGIIVLQEMDGKDVWQIVCYATCIIIVVIGLCVLISGEYDAWEEPSEGLPNSNSEKAKEGLDALPPQRPAASMKVHCLSEEARERAEAAKEDGHVASADFVLKETLSVAHSSSPSLIAYGVLRQTLSKKTDKEGNLRASHTLRQSRSLRQSKSRARAGTAVPEPSREAEAVAAAVPGMRKSTAS